MSHFPNDLRHRSSSSARVLASRSLGVTTRVLSHAFLLLTALGLAPAVAMAQTAHSGAAVNFGSIQVGSSPAVMPVTFTFDSGGTIEAPAVLTMGAANLDFTDAGTGTCTTNGTSHAYSTGDICTVSVKFSPQYAGARNGGVVLNNASGAVIATAYVYGTGVGPQVALSTSTSSALGGGFAGTSGVAVDGSGNVYLTDYGHAKAYEVPPGCTSSACVKLLGGGFGGPVAVDGVGNVYVAGGVTSEIPAGCVSASCVISLGGQFSAINGLAVDDGGSVYVLGNAFTYGDGIYKIPRGCSTLTCMTRIGYAGISGQGLAVDQSGNAYWTQQGEVVWEIPAGCTSTNCRIDWAGVFSSAVGLALDASGSIYVADYGDSAIKAIPAGCASSACVVTLASGFKGAFGLAVDASGNVYVSSISQAQVFEIHRATPPGLSFASTPTGDTSSDSPQTVIIQSIGNETLHLGDVSYPADFPQASGIAADCAAGQALAPGAYCTLSVDFTPLSSSITGPTTSLSESISLTDDQLNGTNVEQSIAVSGTETTAPYITSPSPGTAIGGPTTFTWKPGWAGAAGFQLFVGTTGVGSSNVYLGPTLPGTATSSAPVTIPTSGGTVFVRLMYLYNSTWQYVDYTYTDNVAPTMVSPSPGTVLYGPTTFVWSPNPAVSVSEYQLYVGTSGAGSNNVYWGPDLPGTSTSSASVNIPSNGATLYVRLWYVLNNSWQFVDYTYTEAALPYISTPTPGSSIGSPTTFTLNVGSAFFGVTELQLYVGSTGAGSSDIYISPYLPASTTSSGPININKNSPTIYVRLWYQRNSSWQYRDYTYVQALIPPSISTPAPGSTLGGPTTFTWNVGAGSSKLQLYVGSTGTGSHNIYQGPDLAGTVTSSASINIPRNGAALYVRLWYLVNNSWLYVDYTYTEATAPSIVTPAPGSTLGGPTTFIWNASAGVSTYQIYIGTTGIGSSNLYKGPDLPSTATSSASINIPSNGATLYVRLWYVKNSAWLYVDYTYKEQ